MEMRPISRKIEDLLVAHRRLLEFFTWYEPRAATKGAADFVAGNPQEMPLPEYVAAIKKWTEPTSKDHFAYQMSVPSAQRAIVAALAERRGIRFAEEDVSLTTGAFAGLEVAMRAVCDDADELVYLTPPWFFYDGIARGLGLTPVKVPVDRTTFDIDVPAIERAITPRTRAIIVNSPNNPTGRLYPRSTLDRLATALEAASRRNGRTIYLISDEAYSRILFDGHRYESPTESYAHSILIYTYGKQLLTPGERIGYIALPPTMPADVREQLRGAILMAQLVSGWSWPNAVLQYALPELEGISIDIGHLERKRDRMVKGLRAAGYELHVPEGTFYLLPKAPWRDDWTFTQLLAESGVLVLPGEVVDMPGYFRISVTASDAMIDKALPVFAAVAKERIPA